MAPSLGSIAFPQMALFKKISSGNGRTARVGDPDRRLADGERQVGSEIGAAADQFNNFGSKGLRTWIRGSSPRMTILF
jgi:hypothetical protein